MRSSISRVLLMFLVNGAISAHSPAQTYDYRVPPDQSVFFQGYTEPDTTSPQAIARKLLTWSWHPEVFNASQMGMRIVSSSRKSSREFTIQTTAARFVLAGATPAKGKRSDSRSLSEGPNSDPSGGGEAVSGTAREYGSVVCSTLIGSKRRIATFFLPFSIVSLRHKSAGSVLLELLDARREPSLTIRVMADGLLMIQNRLKSPLTISCDLNFYPGYVGVGQADPSTKKTDLSCLFLDNYGGVGIYLLDSLASYHTDDSIPRVSVTVKEGSIAWVSISPPRPFDWDLSFQRPYVYYGSDTADNRRNSAHHEQNVSDIDNQEYSPERAQILDPYPNWSVFKDWADRKTWASGVSPFDYSSILVT
ncbi:hypothetical protein EHM92_04985, partial [bacterium]